MPENIKEGLISGEVAVTPSSDAAISAIVDRLKVEVPGIVDAPEIEGEILPPRFVGVPRDTNTAHRNVEVTIPIGPGSVSSDSYSPGNKRHRIATIGFVQLKKAA